MAFETIEHHLAKLDVQVETPSSIDAYQLINPADIFRLAITNELHRITGVDISIIYPSLMRLQSLEKGDLTLATPALRCKTGKSADQAQTWAEQVSKYTAKLCYPCNLRNRSNSPKKQFPTSKYTNPPRVTGINLTFFFSHRLLPPLVLPYVFALGSRYGFIPAKGCKDSRNSSGPRKKVVVEFSSPNIAKKFHHGHLRSTIIGAFLANLFERNGWDVIRMNYLGDWGRQYGLLAVGWEKYGSEELLKTNPTAHLFDVYVQISQEFQSEEDAYKVAKNAGQDTAHLESKGLLGASKAYFKRMEAGDPDALALWMRFRNLSVEKYKESYARLNVTFDEYSGESQVLSTTMEKAESILKDLGISHFNAGANIIDFARFGAKNLEVAILRNRTGSTTYLLRDIGAAIQRYEKYGFDHMIYVIMNEQKQHAQRLFKALELMGGEYQDLSRKMQLVDFGRVQGMSTRRGTVKFLDDVLDECASSMHEVMRRNTTKYQQVENPDATANILGISAVMVQDMKGKRINNYPFDINRMTSFEGDTGPYLQYAHARLCSVSRKAGYERDELCKADFSLLVEPHAVDLVRLVNLFPDIVGQSLKTLEPTTVLTYLFQLTHQVSSSYNYLRVLDAPEGHQVSLARGALYEAARQVLSNGMKLLGMIPVDR